MFKKVVSMLLVAAMVVTALPAGTFAATKSEASSVNSYAATDDSILYGDVNDDDAIDLKDELAMRIYIEEESPSEFNFKNADVCVDGSVDLKDLLLLKKYLAEWDVVLGPEGYTVSFYDGDTLLDILVAEKDSPLGEVPSIEKSSKENAILLGYYTDENFTEPFYAENAVTENMNVYAKYQELDSGEIVSITSFAQMDQPEDVSFEIQRVSGDIVAINAAELAVMDGSDLVEISVTDEDGDGVYKVTAPDGFNKGCSYELTLAEGWVFKDKEESIRTASFSIVMEEVENLQMSDEITYVKDTESITYTVDGKQYDELVSDLVTENGGTFVYGDAPSLKVGELICIYVGVNPKERNAENGSELLDPAAYVKVTKIDGNTVSFAQLDETEQQELYEVPDNFPILVDVVPTEATGTVNINALDVSMYTDMIGAEEGTLEKALERVGIGDFITLYVSKEDLGDDAVLYFGQITAYDSVTGEITYVQTTEQVILESMDFYSDINLTGDDLVTEEEKAELEAMLYEQVEASTFAEEAAYYLADVVISTDEFTKNKNIQNMLLTDENGNVYTPKEVRAMNLGKEFELSDDIKLTVELITSGEQLHFGDGVQLAIGVDAGFEVDGKDGGKIAFDLSATFVQEVTIDPSVKGSVIKKKILGIPIPRGVQVTATVDIKSYTALSFAAEIYTVAAEDESLWEQLQDVMKNPEKLTDLEGLPEGLSKGLKTAGDVMDKIEEVENNIKKANATAEQIIGYKEDLEALWNYVEENEFATQEEWKTLGEELGKTSITSDLLEMMDLTTDTELSTEYLDSMQALMDKYTEMLEKETDWVTLVDQEMFTAEVNILGLAIGIETKFMVHTDMSLAIGSNLEYQIGKRYSVWFKVGLFMKPSVGSSSMDLIDEKFAFQFYVMGKLGVKAGIRAKIYVAIGTGKFASVGLTTELGPYIKLYGFFVYEYTKYRPANTQNWISSERMAGALYMDFGLYFKLGVEASAIGGLFEYSHDFVDEEFPLLEAGNKKYYYDCEYEPEEDEVVIVRDEDGNSTNGITMELPDEYRALSYMQLTTGIQGNEPLDYKNYNITLSNPNFTFDKTTGKVNVNVPDDTRFMECDMTLTYLYGKMAFSQYDMSVTIPLVWTNLSTDELKEFYTASVRVGNSEDGYQTVWSKKLLKNQSYDLPNDEEIKEMIVWNDDKYIAGSGYGSQQTTGLTLIESRVYDYDLDYKSYSVQVDGIQKADGTTYSKTYYAKFGEKFDFSDLAQSGTNKTGNYTKFTELTTNATIVVNGQEQAIDLSQPINGKMATTLLKGVTATANYADNGVKVTFGFDGIKHDDIEMTVRSGAVPSLVQIEEIAAENGLAIKEITPVLGKVVATTDYMVTLGESNAPDATIVFEENGGEVLVDLTKKEGSLLGVLPTPVRAGYTFDGWYTDNTSFKEIFANTKMPVGGATVYAKWTANEYTVNFHVNGGNELTDGEKSKQVTFDSAYGTMPVPTRTGYGFTGWFTEAEGGTQITETDLIAVADNQTLYAHWNLLKTIPDSIFNFGQTEVFTYEKKVEREPVYTFTAEDGATYALEDFTFKFKNQSKSEYEDGIPVGAGTYDLIISRPADNVYNKFEQIYTGVMTVNKAVRSADFWFVWNYVQQGYTSIQIEAQGIPDLSPEAKVLYYASGTDIGPVSTSRTSTAEDSAIYNLKVGTKYPVYVKIVDDPNYEDVTSSGYANCSTLAAPTDSWIAEGNYDTSWYNTTDTSFNISTAAQLAGLALLVYCDKDSFEGKTITLTNDISLAGHEWFPIGTSGSPFMGHFDGGNHKVSNVYVYMTDVFRVGLFGHLCGSANNTASIKNLIVGDGYIVGNRDVGGIVGAVYDRGIVTNCANYSYVESSGDGTNSEIGGIAGSVGDNSAYIANCVNYGYICGNYNRAGGIVGYLDRGHVLNNANYGAVMGKSVVGGIVGKSTETVETAYTYNNVNYGTVYGRDSYIGAICGRNYKDTGYVSYGYYLAGSATKLGSSVRNAIGTEDDSLSDGATSKERTYETASFTSPTSALSRDAGYGKASLVDALNGWVDAHALEYSEYVQITKWETNGPNGYPVPMSLLK